MIDATLRLFNAVQVDVSCSKIHSDSVFQHTCSRGYVLSPSVPADPDLLIHIDRVIGLSGAQANQAFHKSWQIVRDTDQETLVVQQMMHYLTTYGLREVGGYSRNTVYIPHDHLQLPGVQEDIPLVIIQGLTKEDVFERLVLLGAGAALTESTLDDMMAIIQANHYDASLLDHIHNRELKSRLYDFYGQVPTEPLDYLRYIVTKITGQSLLIKNQTLIDAIKGADGQQLDGLLEQAPADLASLFLRFKPLFLAMKSISANKHFFNRLRKQATRMHRPLPEDYLNNVTKYIKQGRLDLTQLSDKLVQATMFRKIRLLNALQYRLIPSDSIVYRVRNGRGWATDFCWDHRTKATLRAAYELVWQSMVTSIRSRVAGKTYYIPEAIHYAIPATEKQFTGCLPTGSWVSVPEDLVVGIHWTDTATREIDLDLALVGLSGKIGWDGDYRSQNGDILFSGDMTEAPLPDGASELFYIRQGVSEPKIFTVNYFNFSSTDPVKAKILVGWQTQQQFFEDWVYNMNQVICAANIEVTERQNILGLIVNHDGRNRVYFANMNIGSSITSSVDNHAMHARQYLLAKAEYGLEFADLLTEAGAMVVTEKPIGNFTDLSPQMLTKNSFLSLLEG